MAHLLEFEFDSSMFCLNEIRYQDYGLILDSRM